MRCIILVIAALLLIPVPCAMTQQPGLIKTGQRVRIRSSHYQYYPIIGTVARCECDCLVLDSSDGQEVVLPLDDLIRVQVSRGWKTKAGKGALAGLGVGALGGMLIVALTNGCGKSDNRDSQWNYDIMSDTACYGFAAVLFGSAGALIGLIVGAADRTEIWQEVELDRLRLGIAPRQQGGVDFLVAVTLQ